MIILINAICFANNFVKKGKAENIDVSPMKLQRFLYLLYREYLKKTDTLLFPELFETWSSGPAIPIIYFMFGSYGNSPIKTYGKDSQDNCGYVKEIGTFGVCLEEIWENYKYFSDEQLSLLVCQEKGAWDKAKNTNHRFLSIDEIKNESTLFAD